MNNNTSDQSQVLMGWKDIAKYLNMGVRTVQRYEFEHKLPVRRTGMGPKGAVIAMRPELDEWLTMRPKRQMPTAQPPSFLSKDTIWAALQDGMKRMGELTEQMTQRRAEMRVVINTLHGSIRRRCFLP